MFFDVDHSVSAFLQSPEFLLIKSTLCSAHFLGRRKGQRQSKLFLILWTEKLRPRGVLSRSIHPAWFKGSWSGRLTFCPRRRKSLDTCQLFPWVDKMPKPWREFHRSPVHSSRGGRHCGAELSTGVRNSGKRSSSLWRGGMERTASPTRSGTCSVKIREEGRREPDLWKT